MDTSFVKNFHLFSYLIRFYKFLQDVTRKFTQEKLLQSCILYSVVRARTLTTGSKYSKSYFFGLLLALRLPLMMLHNPLNTWTIEVTWLIKITKSPISHCLLPPKFSIPRDRWKASTLNIIWLHVGHLANWQYLSTFTRLVTTKLDRMLTSGRNNENANT